MTQEEFIKELDREGMHYSIEGGKIIITSDFLYFTEIPSDVEFKGSTIFLKSLKAIPPGVVFSNSADIYLSSIESISPGVEFRNKGNVRLRSVWFEHGECDIRGINPKRLLNFMINKGTFI